MVVNLLINSIQAITQAHRSEGHIDLAIGADGDAVSFSIRHSGLGIAAENLDHVFDSLFTTKKGGMGIGLAICQSIIMAHGGSIAVSNHPEGGAHFRFALPATPSSLHG